MRAQLVPLEGGTPVEIVKDLTLVGRKEECDFRLDHKSVSKMHCVIVKTDGMLLLRDLGSTNGTRVNGQRVRRAALLPNDELTIAGYKFRIHLGIPEERIPAANFTQPLDANDVGGLLHRVNGPALERPVHPPSQPLRPNPLPDVYPAEAANNPDPDE
jgi:predicted component of type VI protein secretion system